ncbi:MAG: DUF4129 domain-containing protein [Alphaproteobacteria bacterium TMED89]|nr:hypothetical protein [Rhodospirillaceae bacterium]RPH14904.1 MAG: DUF4129 domain-containing protein [Alphaproteobacteria bacterium TMED89]
MKAAFVAMIGLGFALPLLAAGSLFGANLAAAQGAPQSDYAELAERHGLQYTFPDGERVAPPASAPGRPLLPATEIDISTLLLWALAIALVGAFAYFILINVRAYREQQERLKTQATALEPVEVWGTVPEDGWQALLHRLRGRSDLNGAVHEMLLAAIGFCQQELSIHIPRAKTPREIQRALPNNFAATDAFETLVQGAELAWFGAKPVDRPMFQRGLDAFERIIALK